MTRVHEAFHVLKVIGRTVDDTLDRIGRQTPEDNPDRIAIQKRLTAIVAMARETANDLRDAGDLKALHEFCCDQISMIEEMGIRASTDGLLAVSTLQDIQSALIEAGIEPRTKNEGEGARRTDPPAKGKPS